MWFFAYVHTKNMICEVDDDDDDSDDDDDMDSDDFECSINQSTNSIQFHINILIHSFICQSPHCMINDESPSLIDRISCSFLFFLFFLCMLIFRIFDFLLLYHFLLFLIFVF